MKKKMTAAVVGFGMVFAAAGTAGAASCEPTSQVVARSAGSWAGLAGPLVATSADDRGLTWSVVDGASLDLVSMETVPTTIGGATISAAVTLPGTANGVMPIAGDDDLVVTFTGTTECGVVADDAIVEIEAAQTVEPTQTVLAAQPAAASATPMPVEIRYLCRLVTYAA